MTTTHSTTTWNEAQLKNVFLEMISCSDQGMVLEEIEEILNTEYQPINYENFLNLAKKLQNSGYITLGFSSTQSGKVAIARITQTGEWLLDQGGFR